MDQVADVRYDHSALDLSNSWKTLEWKLPCEIFQSTYAINMRLSPPVRKIGSAGSPESAMSDLWLDQIQKWCEMTQNISLGIMVDPPISSMESYPVYHGICLGFGVIYHHNKALEQHAFLICAAFAGPPTQFLDS